MSDLQLYIAVGLPIIAVITGLVISLVQIGAIRADMRMQLGAIREDIREIRSDINLLTGKVHELMGQK
jgi:hypothetical protein